MTPTLTLTQLKARDFGASRETQYGVKVPKIALPVTVTGSVATAGMGNTAQILQFEVKANWFALFEGIAFGFSAGLNPGDATFIVDINRPLGVTNTGYTEKDYGAFPFAVGAFTTGPLWPIFFRHRNKEVIRIKALDNVGLGAGAFQAALVGWEWPETSHGS